MKQPEYAQYYGKQLEAGLLYQDFVVDLCYHALKLPLSVYGSRLYQQTLGESVNGCEIKHDMQYARTGNLYFETAEKAQPREGPFAKSGIYRSDNTWLYIIGDYNTVFIFARRMLVMLHGTRKYREVAVKTGTSLGFVMPGDHAIKYAAAVLKPQAEEKVLKLATELAEASRKEFRSLLFDNPGQMMLPFTET